MQRKFRIGKLVFCLLLIGPAFQFLGYFEPSGPGFSHQTHQPDSPLCSGGEHRPDVPHVRPLVW